MRWPRAAENSRSRQLGAVVGLVALVGAGGWFTGTRMESPADAAAAHRPPQAGPVTVAVERQALNATVVAQGSLEFGSPQDLTLAGAVGASEDGGKDAALAQRVTKLPVAGSVLEEGSVLMQVSGRPVFVLRGSVPMYRGLGPGSSGDDVRQLQLALGRLGFGTGGVTGKYRQGTASAVSRWYESKGYQALEPGVGDQQELGQLESAVSDAQLALLAAQSPGGGAKGEAAAPPDSAAAHELALHSAQRRLQLANSALSAYRSGYGTKIAAGEVLFLPKLPVRLDKVKVRLGETPDAQVATVTSSDIVVQAVVPGTDARLLHKGMAVQVRTADGRKARGTIARLGGSPAGSGSAPDSKGSGSDPSAPVPLDVSIADPGPLADSAGGSVTLTVGVGGSDGRVLTVPVAAVHTSVDGKARVRVQRGGRVVDVQVGLGISASGLVEVKPEGGTLEEGSRVVVGR